MRWASAPNDTHAGALQSLAQDTPYLGHSASVVRCRFLLDAPPAELELKASKRRVYPGRLAELERSYRSATRPLAGESVDRPDRVPAVPAPASVFGSRWIVLDDAGGKSPDLRAIALVARRLREALQNHYGKAGLAIPEWISGHQPDGSPSKEPHLAVVPMADIGYEHSEGRLMGLAVVLPRILEEQRRASELRWAGGLEDDQSVAHWRTFQQKLADVSELILGPLGVWRLSRVIESNRPTLQPHRYVKESRQWATATPIVLDRFIKAKSPEERVAEIAAVIADACVNIGLPKPVSVRCAKHPAVRGTPSAYPSGSAPSWTEWSLPGSLTKRMLTHAMIEFAEPVQGPIILGAGRFVGLGLCMAAGANRE
jgi:CRISPR-associated protein Csb2